ncbi:flowering time control protein FPA-like isoform X2 [Amaranthus tricolor]|uniref:flowering time control protein FPA-like isoform X2 n=1 Tax=Amaranthus tricolor TaxID=29722 RepID=UPI002588B1D2|nr:flowering time control protein FPA-like isoform X2 [Amaranthus tricolor]XP_057529830.1 flowering time control protein FPA-like isoform X2 [Amaranthus tricolor]XP_057529860.1 flowering time control protein FPA-like isoform X2 [Amaranthus tricolor]XP_057529890.1 flowering time control protein FPA-like isoform X2 [Amaranthus tricolor]XP_057529925.1 flowering time control protein FPA-like isoform X2 [Amaranthus tricolor]
MGSAYFRNVGDPLWMNADVIRGYPEPTYSGHKRLQAKPSKHVWIGGFSSSVTRERLEKELCKFGRIEALKFNRDRNTAIADFVSLEDALAAVKNLNGSQIGVDRIRVDFQRSQPVKREQSDLRDMGSAQFKDMGCLGPSWINPDMMRNYRESTSSGHKILMPSQPLGGRKGDHPSKVLWVGYPASVIIDEEMLHNAMILYGEIENIKCFPSRHYAFVDFRSVDEARRAKEALHGRLFNDPRISIMFSNSDLAPGNEFGQPYPTFRGQRPDIFGNDLPFRLPLDMFDSNFAMPPNNFYGPPSNSLLGPPCVLRPFGSRGSLDPLLPSPDFHDPNLLSSMSELTSIVSFNQRKLSHSAAGLLPSPILPGMASHKTRGWDVLDPNQLPRESKRPRIEGLTSFQDPNIVGKGGECNGSADEPYSAGQFMGAPLSRPQVDNGLSLGNVMERSSGDLIWHGVISKGGNHVCHARCVPMGKGLEFELPEIVNCCAKTGLDMLAKHYAGAIGFDIVFFLPDREEDFANYTEFLQYLGSNNRAGVAKLDDGTTLFLVPPSDFLTDVLKVAGRERLYGVVLKLPQQLPGGPSVPQMVHQPNPPVQQTDSQLGPPKHEYGTSEKELAIHVDYHRALHENAGMHSKTSFPKASVSRDQSYEGVSSTSRPAVTITPELIATLQALMPANSQSSVTQSGQPRSIASTIGLSSPAVTNEKGAFSQGWNQQFQVDPNVQSQQLGVQGYPNANFDSYVSSHPFPANTQLHNPAYNLQEQELDCSRPLAVHSIAAQNQQYVPSMQNSMQPYSTESPRNIEKSYGMVHGTHLGSYEIGDTRQNPDPELQKSPQRTQTLPSGVGQGTSDVEERYRSTLQFAANLLFQIKQQPQLQQGNSHMGNQQ